MKSNRKKTSKAFSRMTPRQRRVAIAQDVLAQIDRGQFVIQIGRWVNFGTLNKYSQASLARKSMPPKCICCAIGAACVSAIRLFNKDIIEGGQIEDYNEAFKILRRHFSRAQADMIEAAFEVRIAPIHRASAPVLAPSIDFGESYSGDSRRRARAIFQNIIDNHGTFKPTKA